MIKSENQKTSTSLTPLQYYLINIYIYFTSIVMNILKNSPVIPNKATKAASMTYMSIKIKNFLLKNPTQLFIHGQWWSILSTHLLQAEQWCDLSGLKIWHIRQYLLFFYSGSSRKYPQYNGTRPGSVNMVLRRDHISIKKIILKKIM